MAVLFITIKIPENMETFPHMGVMKCKENNQSERKPSLRLVSRFLQGVQPY